MSRPSALDPTAIADAAMERDLDRLAGLIANLDGPTGTQAEELAREFILNHGPYATQHIVRGMRSRCGVMGVAVAAAALAGRGFPDSTRAAADAALAALLQSPHPSVRASAALGLGRLATPRAMKSLTSALPGETHPAVRAQIRAHSGAKPVAA